MRTENVKCFHVEFEMKMKSSRRRRRRRTDEMLRSE
jgi:hypothetical protein